MQFTAALMIVGLLPLGEITVGGARPVVVHVPPSYDPATATPLLIALHGYWDTNYIEDYLRLQPVANARGLLYAYPSGTVDCSGSRFWNASSACCNICESEIDDAAYLRGVITETQAALNVDPTRIYVIGHSNGGFMSYRMACHSSDLVAAIVSIAGASDADPTQCMPIDGVHVLQIHGTADTTIKYAGGTLASFFGLPDPNARPYPGAIASVEEWAFHDGCTLLTGMGPRLDLDQSLAGSETVVTRYMNQCKESGSADLWTIEGGPHNPNFGPKFGDALVDWLLKHPKGIPIRAAFTFSAESGPAPLDVAFDGAESSTVDGAAITSYDWDFGDGASEIGRVAHHTYATPGRYFAFLTITTDGGQVDTTGLSVTVRCPPSSGVAPWTAADVGVPPYPGSVRLGPADSAANLILCAGGTGISSRRDVFFLVHQVLAGDFQITAKVSAIMTNQCKVGLIARASLDPDSPFAAIMLESLTVLVPNRFRWRYRAEPGAASRSINGATLAEHSAWIRLERRSNVFAGCTSPDGIGWTPVGEQTVDAIPAATLVGIVAAANDVRPDLPFKPFQGEVSELRIVPLAAGVPFHRADPNSSGTTDISDALTIFGYLFLGSESPTCPESADVNNSGEIDISDGIAILQWLFGSGPPPAAPGPPPAPCGLDPDPAGSTGDLGCESYDCG